jgi:alpha-L-fucosidase
MMKLKKLLATGWIFIFLASVFTLNSCKEKVVGKYKPTWESLSSHPTPAWFRDAKFGIFIHWGVYSVPAYHEWYLEFISPKSNWGETPGGPPYTAAQGELSDSLFNAKVRKKANEYHRINYGVDFEYDDFIPMFKAEHFDPGSWADLFRDAGARYVVMTAKHGDEFAMWPSKVNRRNAMKMGPHRDLAGELAAAVRSRGMKMGFYHNTTYSFWDKRFPNREWVKFMNNSIMELVDRYKPDILWGDVVVNPVRDIYGQKMDVADCWNSKEVIAWFYNHSENPDEVVTNDRWGLDTTRAGILSEKAFSKSLWAEHERNWCRDDAAILGDFQTPERRSITKIFEIPWETCDALDPTSWGYNKQTPDSMYMKPDELIDYLADIVSKGGNLLINIGPRADGTIPEVMQNCLRDAGSWLKINGESIYGTRPWKVYGEGPTTEEVGVLGKKGKRIQFLTGDIRFTIKERTLYAILLEWPGTQVTIHSLKGVPVKSISILGTGEPAQWQVTEGGIVVQLPAQPVSPFANTLKIEIEAI